MKDPPFYTPARAGRRVHICNMAGHSRYWLNVSVTPGLWTCEKCHPPTFDPLKESGPSCAMAMGWEIMEKTKC